MSNYNPYRAQERHRRARVQQNMTAQDFARCMGVAVITVLVLFMAAIA